MNTDLSDRDCLSSSSNTQDGGNQPSSIVFRCAAYETAIRLSERMDNVLKALENGAERMEKLEMRQAETERKLERDSGRREVLVVIVGAMGGLIGAILPLIVGLVHLPVGVK